MISVVTITFNNHDELKKTLESISAIQNIESVVINGGSSEDSIALLKNHLGTVINEKDEGIADAFNKGVRNSTGQAVVYLNSGDVLLDHEYYLWADRALSEDPSIDFVYSDIVFNDPISGEFIMKPRGRGLSDLGRGMPFPHPSMVVRRKIFEQIGHFSKDFKIAMDFDFVVKLLAAGHRGVYYPHETVKMDGSGVSSAREYQGIMECKKSLVQHGEFTGKIRFDFEMRRLKYVIRSRLKTLKSKLK